MPKVFGDPSRPCVHIERSKTHLTTIAREARANAERGTADSEEVEAGLTELRSDVAQRVGKRCSEICGPQTRCMMDTFGPNDPLLTKRDKTPAEADELDAKRQMDSLSLLAERSLGISFL